MNDTLCVYSVAFTASVMIEAHSNDEAEKLLRETLFNNKITGHTISIVGSVRTKNNGMVI